MSEGQRALGKRTQGIIRTKRWVSLKFQLELFCEAYYLIAWRASESIATLPGLEKFSVVGIRDVRNRLIEHPNKKGGVYEWSTSFASGIGLILKPSPRNVGQPANLDPGFWNNVMNLYAEILNRV